MKKGRVILEAAIFAIISFVVLKVVLSTRIVPAVIFAILIFFVICVRSSLKYMLKKEREDEYK